MSQLSTGQSAAEFSNEGQSPNSGLPLATVSPKGKAPKYRLKNPVDAQSIVTTMWNANLKRMRFNAAIQGQFDGNPPYQYSYLRSQGRANDPNFNTLEAKALRSTALVPYYDLFCGDDRYVDFATTLGDDHTRQRWNERISALFDKHILRDGWRGYDGVMQTMLCDFVSYGKGFLEPRDCYSFRYRKVSNNRVLVPDATPISIDDEDLDCIVVLQDWSVTALYDRVANDGAAKEAGWNVSEVYKALAMALPRNPNTPFDPIATQKALYDGDIYMSARTSTVQTAAIYVREFDGKWSHLIVQRNTQLGGAPDQATNSSLPEWLFESRSCYDTVTDFLAPFFYDAGATSWNGAHGIGRDIFTAMQLKDRLACALAMSVFLRASLVLQPKTALDRNKMNAIQLGAVTYIPENVDVIQSSVLGDITSNIEVSRELDRTIERNTGIYRPTLEKGSGNPQTLGEFETKFAQATALSTSAINRFWDQLDRFYESLWKRVKALIKGQGADVEVVDKSYDESTDSEDVANEDKDEKAVKAFLKACKDEGIPREALLKINVTRAWRSVGAGSAALRKQVLAQFIALYYPLLRPNGQEALLRDAISVSSSPGSAERYMPQSDWPGEPSNDESFAMVENGIMMVGAPALVTGEQDHIIHAETHLHGASQASASLAQGADPHKVLNFLETVGPHIAAHLKEAEKNPIQAGKVKDLVDNWKLLVQTTTELRRKLEQEAQQQQAQQQKTQAAWTDEQIAQFDAQSKAHISAMKAQQTLQLKGQRQEAELALKAQKQNAELGLKAQATGAQVSIADAQAAAGIHRENAQVLSDIRRDTLREAAKGPGGEQ